MNDDRFGYDEMSNLFKEAQKEKLASKEEEKYKEIRRTSKREQANAFLESLSTGRKEEPAIEPPMDGITMEEIEQIPRKTTFEPYDATKADNLLNSLKSEKQAEFEYTYVEEQPLQETKIIDVEKVKETAKKAIAILATIGVLTAGAITYGKLLHERDENMMEGMSQYSQFLEETGQTATEENYKYFVDNVYEQDAPQESSGGRTNG